MQKPTAESHPDTAAFLLASDAYDKATLVNAKVANVLERCGTNIAESAALIYGKTPTDAQAVADQIGGDDFAALAFESIVINWLRMRRGLAPVKVVPDTMELRINGVPAAPAAVFELLNAVRAQALPANPVITVAAAPAA